MYFDNEQKDIVKAYLDKSVPQKLFSFGNGQKIANAVKEYLLSDYTGWGEKHNNLVNVLWAKNKKHIQEVFEGKDFEALKLLLGDKNASIFKRIWDRSVNYTYTSGYARRSYRTQASTKLYLEKNIIKLQEYIYLAATEFSLESYLTANAKENPNVLVISDMIAVEIDDGNDAVFNHIKDIIYNDNNTAIVTREIIRGLLMSRSEKVHAMIGELLLAAKLQEGLRQSIVESMDECSRECFVYLLKIIIDHDLTRFSSVARAFSTWTGLGLDVEKPKVINKCFEAAYNCTTDKAYLKECLDSADNLLIYIGLWAVAFDEVEDIDKILQMLLNSDQKYKRQSALMFLYETQFTVFRHQIASRVLEDPEMDVVVLSIKNLFGNINTYSIINDHDDQLDDFRTSDKCYGSELFYKLRGILEKMPKKEIEFNGIVFPWVNLKLSESEILDKMLMAVALDYNDDLVDLLLDYKDKMSVDARHAFVQHFLKHPRNEKQRTELIMLCGDRGTYVRKSAYNIVCEMTLCTNEYRMIEDFLQYKSGDLRKNCIKLMLRQRSDDLFEAIVRLMESKNENKRLGAIDLVSALESDDRHVRIRDRSKALITSACDVSQKEKVLVKHLLSEDNGVKTLDMGLGLFDMKAEPAIGKISDSGKFDLSFIFVLQKSRVEELLKAFDDLIHENRDYEYTVTDYIGSKTTVTLGGSYWLRPLSHGDYSLGNYPIADKVKEFVRKNNLTCFELNQLNFCIKIAAHSRYTNYQDWFDRFIEKSLKIQDIRNLRSYIEKLLYISKTETYLECLVSESPGSELFELGKSVSEYLFLSLPADCHMKEYVSINNNYYHNEGTVAVESFEMSYWLRLMKQHCNGDDAFRTYFTIAYNFYKACGYKNHATLDVKDFGRALELGIIDGNEMFKELISRPLSAENIQSCTNDRRRMDLTDYKQLLEVRDKAVDAITAIEVKRGELNTEVTHLAAKIGKCYGADIFVSIILSSEKDTYVRGYNFVSGDSTKKQMLSYLLKCCYPKATDSVDTLKTAVGTRKVSDKQLIEAAMYAPQWLDIVSEHLGYDGLKSACWYFHAHVNDVFSDEKEAIVARYSPVASQDFRDGAFDAQWFIDAYETVGEKRFKLVYDSAKYIADGSLHKRSQLFADAVLGKLNIDDVKNRIQDKRNKDYLLTYSIVPVKDRADLLSRYEYIQQYLKESRQFGAQRQASEGRSARVALVNLARNAGYSDVNRLSWDMETEKLDSIKSYLQPYDLEDVAVWLDIDESGSTTLCCSKNGKELKAIPGKYKKHEYVVQLTAIRKALNDQYARARISFEELMEKGESFEAKELMNLMKNPVLSPIVSTLVYKTGARLGFLADGALVDYEGNRSVLSLQDNMMIAHPVHLFEAGEWLKYQKYLFAEKRVQPFKQVFRELYLPNADELAEGNQSRRYAGHQVQPRKTLALLKKRGWLASYEDGLQKVFYKENLIATIYAIADWFAPSEIESPVIELVRFEDRKTNKPVDLASVPKLVFSEVMRDVDLVVSVAHVGGVDPEASLSTIEIRTVIVEELMKLLKLENVAVKGSHAHIAGVHGEYTVHLGSGVTHKMGTGALNILPVHSGHRGRLFLPFIDDDPKSVEILSKIVLLAEDKKMKDPSILVQIV